MNDVTRKYLEKVKAGTLPGVRLGSDGKVTPTDSLLKKLTEHRSSAKPPEPPYLKREGLFTGTLIKKHDMETSDGVVLTLALADLGVYRAAIFLNGFAFSPEVDEILLLLSEGDELTFRMGRNFRGTKFYIRYLKYQDREIGNLEEPTPD